MIGAGWTEARTSRLKVLWREGLTASAIAAELGIGRGAVIGKVSRLRRQDASLARRAASPAKPRLKLAVPEGPPSPPLEPGQSPKTILELVPRQCRAPLWRAGPLPARPLFCADRALEGSSYCAHHHPKMWIKHDSAKVTGRAAAIRKQSASSGAWIAT
jgi:GcrA cell cycle regulator